MFYGRTFNDLLLDETQRLIARRPDLPAGQVIAAVARAKIHLRDLYSEPEGVLPAEAEVVSCIVAMASQDLLKRSVLDVAS